MTEPMPITTDIPVHEDTARYDLWIKVILGAALAVTLIPLMLATPGNHEEYLWSLGTAVSVVLLFWSIMPRRFQIFEDRLRIVLGTPFAVNIRLSNISEAHLAPGGKALISSGIRFATSTNSVVEIVRKKGLNITISPQSGDTFVRELNHAIGAASLSSEMTPKPRCRSS